MRCRPVRLFLIVTMLTSLLAVVHFASLQQEEYPPQEKWQQEMMMMVDSNVQLDTSNISSLSSSTEPQHLTSSSPSTSPAPPSSSSSSSSSSSTTTTTTTTTTTPTPTVNPATARCRKAPDLNRTSTFEDLSDGVLTPVCADDIDTLEQIELCHGIRPRLLSARRVDRSRRKSVG